MSAPDDDRRGAELVSALGAVRARIADSCAAVGRDAQTVTLVAVTKTYPASDVATLARLGVTDIGESKDQEARTKVKELRRLDLRWHLVGRVQTNKARDALKRAALTEREASVLRLMARGLTAGWAIGAKFARQLRTLEAAALEETISGRWQALTTTFPLAEAAAAHRALETRETLGKVVLLTQG